MRATRELVSPLALALALATAAMFFGGGASTSSLPWLGTAAALAVLVLFAWRGLPGGLTALAPFALLAIWVAVSIEGSIEPDRRWDYANRALVYLLFAVVGTFVAGHTKDLMVGLAAVLGAVCVWALAGKVVPALYEDYGRIARLRGPVGYWNSLALLGDIALPIALCLATRWRVPGVLLLYGWIVAIGLTYSRGGVVVGVIVVAAWVVLSRAWADALGALVAAGIPAAGALAVAFTLAGVTDDAQTHTTRVHDGILFGVVLLLDAAIAAALARFEPPAPTEALRKGALALVAVVAAAAIVVGALHAHSWWNSFTSTNAAEISNSKDRFADLGSNHRWSWWTQAGKAFEAHPFAGTGAGSFHYTNLRYRTTVLDVTQEPHDLPLQFLSETGIVGLVLLLATFGWLIAVGRRRPGPQLALALALPAFFLHALLDIDWDFAAVAAPVFLIAGALVARPAVRRPSFFAVLSSSGLAFAIAASLFSVWLSDRWTGEAEGLLGTNNPKAVQLLDRARSLDPLSVQTILDESTAKQALGNRSDAYALLKKATDVQPESEDAWYALGLFNYQTRNCAYLALSNFERAYELNSQDPSLVIKDKVLALVNSGTEPNCTA